MKKKALLIIDIQKDAFNPSWPCYDGDGVIDRINDLSTRCRQGGIPVILVQHNGTQEGDFLPGTTGWELLEKLKISSSDMRIEKTANDSFYRTNLQQILTETQITELIITGCATDFCIDSTVQSALAKDYSVVVAKDGHTTNEHGIVSAQKLVEHYNWLWGNLAPTRGNVVVKAVAEIAVQ